jgi:hypothetical protein
VGVAAEAECGADVYRMFEELAGRVPLLAAVRPNGEVPIEAFEDAGGARAVMKQLEPLLDTSAMTVTGRTVGQNLAGVTVADEDVIRPPERALGHRPTIVLIRGSLAPDGGIVKLAVADDRRLDFAGPAVVFDSPAQSLDAVRSRRAPCCESQPHEPGSAGTPALAVRGLSVAYGAMVAVHDATFSIDPGEACAGPNGNGKSSPLMGIAGLVRRRGGVEIFGRAAPAGDVRWATRHGLTLVPERRQLYPGLSAADNIVLGCYCWTSSIRKARNSGPSGRPLSSSRRSDRT